MDLTPNRTQETALIVLRTLVGWHFLYEGLAKTLWPAWSRDGAPLARSRKPEPKGRGKAGAVEAVENHKTVFHRSHRPLEIPPSRDSRFPTATTTRHLATAKRGKPRSASRRGVAGLCNLKRTDHG